MLAFYLIVLGFSKFVSRCILNGFNIFSDRIYNKFTHNFYLVCFYFSSLMLIRNNELDYNIYQFHIFHYIYDLHNVILAGNKEYIYHHVVSLFLLLISFPNYRVQGMQLIGALDHGNFLLSIGKCCSYLEPYTDRWWRLNHFVGVCSFFFFLLSFVYYRLYWFLEFIRDNAHNGLHFKILLGLLYVLQIYWFYFVLKMTKRVFVGQYNIVDGH